MRAGLAGFAVLLLLSCAAFAIDKNDSGFANGAAPVARGHAGPPTPDSSSVAHPGGHGGGRGDGPRRPGGHHRGGGTIFWPWPYPGTWPYPSYPYRPYSYPYPYPDDGDDDSGSTRGLVVPGDLPMGIVAYWYYCDAPDGYYPYVKSCSHDWTRIPISPPPPGTAAPVSYSDWQWCEDKKAFFPYVTSCLAGFTPVPVTAPGKDQAGPPQVANWYFCDEPRGYSPYVVQCAHDWRAVPAVPPPSVKITVKDGKEK